MQKTYENKICLTSRKYVKEAEKRAFLNEKQALRAGVLSAIKDFQDRPKKRTGRRRIQRKLK